MAPMATTIRTFRLLGALTIIVAIVAMTADAVSTGTFVAWDFFGFFTIQSNTIAAASLLLSLPYTSRERPAWVDYLRVAATTYLIVVVAVFWLLLGTASGQGGYPWTNSILHAASGVILVLDWIWEGPRTPPALSGLWSVLVYPLVWLVVVLIRGATDGWVPYPFLDPAHGYGSIVVVVAAILVVASLVALGLRLLTRWRVPSAGPRATQLDAKQDA